MGQLLNYRNLIMKLMIHKFLLFAAYWLLVTELNSQAVFAASELKDSFDPLGITQSSSSFTEKSINYDTMIKEEKNGLYIGKIKNKLLWIVGERITDANIEDWQQYAREQASEKSHNFTQRKDGVTFFKKVLNKASYKDNEVFVFYITSRQDIQSNVVRGYKLGASHPAASIAMFVTVTSNPKALITSHMGISITHENAVYLSLGKGASGISMDLHSFAAKVMLSRNPDRRYMINAPNVRMEAIIAKFVPKVFIGTVNLIAKRNACKMLILPNFDEFVAQMNSEEELKNIYLQSGKKEIEAQKTQLKDKAESSKDKANALLLQDHSYETIKMSGSSSHLLNYLDYQEGGTFVVSQNKLDKEIESIMESQYILFKSAVDNCNSLWGLQEAMSVNSNEIFDNYLAGHPPILSASFRGARSSLEKLVVYDENNREEKWLEINKDNVSDRLNYNWMFTEPFLPAYSTHYIAASLAGLANAIKHEEINKTPENKTDFPQPILWNGDYPYVPGNKGMKHYLYKEEFYKYFPNKEAFDASFSGKDSSLPKKDYGSVRFPPGYEGEGPTSPRIDITSDSDKE